MAISVDDARWIAHLARLELTGAELEAMARQLSDILDSMRQLEQLDTTGVEPLAHPLPIENVFRPDELVQSLPLDEALANAPHRIGDYYGVPAVFD
jgi:aspartyl-tRNA(Asn)/glutamyl-tRNA(Gln) amidotransferase subunit C